MPFRWSSLHGAQQALLDLNPGSGTSDLRGQDRLAGAVTLSRGAPA